MSRVDTARRKATKAQKAAGRAGRNARKTTSTTAERLAPAVETARGSASAATSYVEDAAERVQPHIEAAVERVKEDVVPKLTEAVAQAVAASEPVREEALTRGTAAWAALRGEVEPPRPKRRRWLRRLGLVVGVTGAAAGGVAAWSKMSQPDPPYTVGDEHTVMAGRDAGAGAPPVVGVDADTASADSPSDSAR